MRLVFRFVLIVVATVSCAACDAPKTSARDAGVSACSSVGQTCEFSPGKLGTCVQKDECAMPPCFVCQSQH